MKPFFAWVTESQRVLHAFILTLAPDFSDAEDILQETNLVLWEKQAEFTPGTDFRAWAFRIARYQVMAHRKRQSRSRLVFDEVLMERLAKVAAGNSEAFDARREALAGCLKKLAPEQQQLLAQRYGESLSGGAIAESLGVTPDAVYQTLHRTRDALLRCIRRALRAERA